ncbi:MAG: hypothetical protein JRJ87_12875 [Deltaproteobacteria bacterium]|nr:hypothetical protein [Deltaproteobacteria bacterium]
MSSDPFRICRLCNQSWSSFDEFIHDPKIQLVGLQAVPKIPKASVLVFIHEGCGSISVLTSKLRALLDLPQGYDPAAEACQGCFRDLTELCACKLPCTIAGDRQLTQRVIQLMRS